MAKRPRPTPAVNCVCSKCGATAHSIPDKPHRKCRKSQKGMWQPE